jgi:hypothetical protein
MVQSDDHDDERGPAGWCTRGKYLLQDEFRPPLSANMRETVRS